MEQFEVDSDHQFSTQELLYVTGILQNSDANETGEISLNNSGSSGLPLADTSNWEEDNNDLLPDISSSQSNNEKARKRRKKADKSQWKRQFNQNKRMRGEEYEGFGSEKTQGNKRKFFTGIKRKEKSIGEPCRSKICQKRKEFFCSDFSEEVRQEMFTSFWKTLDWKQKRSLVSSLVDVVPVKRRTPGSLENKRETLVYSLKLNEKRVRVCRQMFLSTLGLGQYQVLKWARGSNLGMPSPKTVAKRIPIRQKENSGFTIINDFLDRLPKLPSHYCRASSTKLYLEPCFNSKNKLYEVFKEFCVQRDLPTFSRCTFNKVFAASNVGLFSPRKDQCDTCVAYQHKQITDQEYETHLENKNLARDEKNSDKLLALQGKCHVLTMDLQAVLLSPKMKASALYYKTKLMVHNFTVYNLATKKVTCYVWDESEGDLASSTFASCLVDFIKTALNDNLPVIIFSDGCTYQNRNCMMANAMLDCAMKMNRTIYQKYLAKGHTQMECDSVHSAIEAQLKNKDVFCPADYHHHIRMARSKMPYEVKPLQHTFFSDYSLKKHQRFTSIRPGTRSGDPCVTDLRMLRYSPNGAIHYKLGYTQSDWKTLPQKSKQVDISEYPPLFNNRIKIASRKFQDLQELKAVLPDQYHSYYDDLPH